MKRLQKNVALAAVVLGLTSAFAFSAAAKKPFTNYWFNTTPAGAPTSYRPTQPDCSETTGEYCAKEYAASQLNFNTSGVPVSVISGQENLQILAEHKGL